MNEHDLQERKAFLEATGAFLDKSDYLTVLSLAESRLKRTPGDLDARIVICRVWIEQERFEEAGEMLLEMEDILASLSQIYTRMGDIYLKKGMPESAQVFYRMYVSLNPDTPVAREISERIEDVSQQQATDDGAIAEKEEAARVPDDFQTVTLAELYARQGHLRMAEEILEAILNKGPYHPKAADMLREVRERIATQEEPGQTHATVMPREAGETIVGREEPEEMSVPEMLPEVREGIATREEPGEKQAPVMLREAQEKVVDREEPGDKRVVDLLRELQELRKKIASRQELRERHAPAALQDVDEKIAGPEEPWQKHAPVIAELSRWLNNIERLSSHAA